MLTQSWHDGLGLAKAGVDAAPLALRDFQFQYEQAWV